METLVIGIAGPSGGGKTTVTKLISEKYTQGEVSVISYDNYYKDQSDMPFEERVNLNYDHPSAFDTDLLLAQIKALKSGQAIDMPTYDFAKHTRAEETILLKPTHIIIVEGLFPLLEEEIRELFNLKLYVETDSDICFIRRLHRDIKERGRDIDSVTKQYLDFVKPMYEQFIAPTRKNADLVVLNGGENGVAIEMITNYIDTHVDRLS